MIYTFDTTCAVFTELSVISSVGILLLAVLHILQLSKRWKTRDLIKQFQIASVMNDLLNDMICFAWPQSPSHLHNTKVEAGSELNSTLYLRQNRCGTDKAQHPIVASCAVDM